MEPEQKQLWAAYRAEYTQGPYSAAGIVKKLAEEGADTIVVGGDGTVLEVAMGIVACPGCNLKLGIMTAGSGNDFIRSVKIPRNTEKALALILAGRYKTIDAIAVNGCPVLNIASIGIDAEIVSWTDGIRQSLERLHTFFRFEEYFYIPLFPWADPGRRRHYWRPVCTGRFSQRAVLRRWFSDSAPGGFV